MPDFPLPAGSCRYIMSRISHIRVLNIVRYNVRANVREFIYVHSSHKTVGK
jgi:hypothetical protein